MKKPKGNSAEAAFQRSKVYRLLSYCFTYPTEDFVEFLGQGEFTDQIVKALQAHPLKQKTATLIETAKAIKSYELELMKDEYIRLFTLKSECPPYETEYGKAQLTPFSSEGMADIAGFYRAWGLDFIKDRPDNLATELEFMHLVTMREAEAIFQGETGKGELCRSVGEKFLLDHLGRWVDAFSEAVFSEGRPCYYPISRLLRDWIKLECDYFKIVPLVPPGKGSG